MAYAGEDGEVAIFKERMLQDNRMRRAHTTVAGPSDLSVNLAPSNSHLSLCSMDPFMVQIVLQLQASTLFHAI